MAREGWTREQKSIEAEQRFRMMLKELGVTLIDTTWRGSRERHQARCANGHAWWPRPVNVFSGSVCGKCRPRGGSTNRRDSHKAYADFLMNLAVLEIELLEDSWLGVRKDHRVRCERCGHGFTTRPAYISEGYGGCRPCRGLD